jgi:hypothetical protein
MNCPLRYTTSGLRLEAALVVLNFGFNLVTASLLPRATSVTRVAHFTAMRIDTDPYAER